ncbi:MAG: FlgK family flagellar hook-associated protein, partial [Bryobacteraceae bacterium]
MSLFSALTASAQSLLAFQQSLDVVQNNINNASTPGFARQRQPLLAKLFQPEQGVAGGVETGARQSLRNDFAEVSVRRQTSALGRSDQLATTLSGLEAHFDATGETGIPKALSELFAAFSSLSINPNASTARQTVLDQAAQLAVSFNTAAQSLSIQHAESFREVGSIVDRVNQLVARIRDFNVQSRSTGGQDAGVEAQLYASLEELSELVDFTALRQTDGTITLLLGGQSGLLIGDRQYNLQADFSTGSARLLDPQGVDVTAQLNGGRLSGAIHAANVLIPGYLSELNQLAASLADTVNST